VTIVRVLVARQTITTLGGGRTDVDLNPGRSHSLCGEFSQGGLTYLVVTYDADEINVDSEPCNSDCGVGGVAASREGRCERLHALVLAGESLNDRNRIQEQRSDAHDGRASARGHDVVSVSRNEDRQHPVARCATCEPAGHT